MRWQSRLRCRLWSLHDTHCSHPLTSGWVIEEAGPWMATRWAADPETEFATYLPETMRHAAPRKTLLARIRTWWKKATTWLR